MITNGNSGYSNKIKTFIKNTVENIFVAFFFLIFFVAILLIYYLFGRGIIGPIGGIIDRL